MAFCTCSCLKAVLQRTVKLLRPRFLLGLQLLTPSKLLLAQ